MHSLCSPHVIIACHWINTSALCRPVQETLLKMDDTKALISLYVEDSKWDDAFLLLHAHPGEISAQGVLACLDVQPPR